MTKEQCDFHIDSVVGDWFAPALERALHAVFHRIDMQVQLIGGGFETGPGVQELPQRPGSHPFSLAIGVFVDGFLVRMTLVPAVLALLGRRAWGLPGWIDRRLPVFDAEGDALIHELRLADWPSPDSDDAINASGLRRADDRGRDVYSGVDLTLGRGQILVIHGHGPAGKSALLFTLAGRVRRIEGDLKVLGHILPQHIHTVRREVAVISCHETTDPAADVAAALAGDIELILLDDVDTVVRNDSRERLRQSFSDRKTRSGKPATFVVTCQDPALIGDLLPTEPNPVILELSSEPVEVTA